MAELTYDREHLRELLLSGVEPDDAALVVGCSRATAHKWRRKWFGALREPGQPHAGLAQAVEAVRQGLSLRGAAEQFAVPKNTLRAACLREGVDLHRNIGLTGVDQVVDALRARGHAVVVMPHLHTFDLLLDGRRCELKCSNRTRTLRNLTGVYTFALAGSASGAKDSHYVKVRNGVAYKTYAEVCDVALLAGFDCNVLERLYLLPASELPVGKRNLKIHPEGHVHADKLLYEL